MTLIPNQRHLFDIPDEVAYLNVATMGPLPLAAARAGQQGLARKLQPWTIPDADFFEDTRRLRPLLAELVGADEAGIAFVPSASYGLATAARNITLAKGQKILLLEDQFPSNVYTWRALARATGAVIETIGAAGNTSLSQALLQAITPDTGLVACAHVRWTDGARLDLVAIGARCREVGAALVLDLTQSCGAMSFDMRDVQPDFVVVAGYKWLLGPYALGFLYAAPHRRTGVPLEQNWINREGAADFSRLIDYTDAYAPGAERYDMGERSNFALLPAFHESVRQILDWGIDRVEATLAHRNRALAAELEGLGLPAMAETERGPHYLGALLPETAPADLTARLKAEKIYVSKRGNRLRITPHLFTSDEDVARFLAALKRHLG
ncbi:MAG: aminotransferase class V-fold PLP-dependent enzyme [Hyphomonas sp.]|uniref:aminotransferase class V-fold PLP-dependent enzyme n=1 Tax=Hyphomonas sp. TaxID=87 RepID=UPI00185AAFBA|nr:aminotransferase class V-fold PLP-dependent enzyme [Hyphomonas sp.]MBU3919828.1 aminotransferase class V-fold PLP-dependent enzyme [Alphaproteobacteria bacterium]MBA3070004.1 aminotransferase class V-fold PLP-dependent enzyme [Hyphomonas sp.]MBU4060420.1 aminotransferase class V-fold PLP-dependent enzyme [Alphaproteobacteria bacterium]MBU4163088.1 aminotransferase class V-fold PLP-dependent enzyme [Alphaproteobacteria bacterium]MBU4568349.1 aminotransferase class V-fold PLP-dependent enzyme